jgi:hypothetical protein
MSAIGGGARILLSLALLAGCTHDFDTFAPSGPTDGAAADSVGTDSGVPDSTPADSSADTTRPDTAPPPCVEPGSKTFAGHCYFPTATAVTWSAGKSACAAAGGHLVTITSPGEEATVEVLQMGTDRWIGLSRPPGSPSTDASFQWVTAESMVYKSWAAGQPSGSGECGRLTSSGPWADMACSTTLTAICER